MTPSKPSSNQKRRTWRSPHVGGLTCHHDCSYSFNMRTQVAHFPSDSAHTEKYYSQLSAYHAALTEAGIEVSDTFVYYPVQGHLRKLVK